MDIHFESEIRGRTPGRAPRSRIRQAPI